MKIEVVKLQWYGPSEPIKFKSLFEAEKKLKLQIYSYSTNVYQRQNGGYVAIVKKGNKTVMTKKDIDRWYCINAYMVWPNNMSKVYMPGNYIGPSLVPKFSKEKQQQRKLEKFKRQQLLDKVSDKYESLIDIPQDSPEMAMIRKAYGIVLDK